jgi:hypothetical protein
MLQKMSIVTDKDLEYFYRRLSSAFKDYKKKVQLGSGPRFKKGDWVQVGRKKQTAKPMIGQVFECVNPEEINGEYKYRICTVDPKSKKLSKNPHRVSIVEHRVSLSVAGKVLYGEEE